MVFIIEKWEDIEEHVRYARCVLYQIVNLGDKVELRVKAGMLGWTGVFDKNDAELKRILKKLEDYDAVKVVKSMPDELFMSKS